MRFVVCLAFATALLTLPLHAREDKAKGCLEWLTSQQCEQLTGAITGRTALHAAVEPKVNWSPQPCSSNADMCAHSFPQTTPSFVYCESAHRNVSCSIDYCEYDSCSDTNCYQDHYKSCCGETDHVTTTSWSVCF